MPERKSPEKSASLYKIGTKKKGNDNNMWIIIENKNGVKRWILHKKSSNIINNCNSYDNCASTKKIMNNPDAYYKQFLDYKKPINDITFFTKKIKLLQKELEKIGVLFFVLKWDKKSLYDGHYDIINQEINKLYKKNIKSFDRKYPNGILHTSDRLLYDDSLDTDAIIRINHTVDSNIISKINKILIDYFPNRTLGIQNERDKIIINIKEKLKIMKKKKN